MAEKEKQLVRKVLIKPEEITDRIKSMADEIATDFKEKTKEKKYPELILLCVLESARVYTKELATELKKLGIRVKIVNVTIKSYDGMRKTDNHEILSKFPMKKLRGEIVLVVEDMIDTGGTLEALINELNKFKPQVLDVAVLLEKIKARFINLKAKYVGFEIFDFWVDGKGIDTDGEHRLDEWISAVILKSDDEELVKFWRLVILNNEDKELVESVRSLMLMLSWYNTKYDKYKDNSPGLPPSDPVFRRQEVDLPGQRRHEPKAKRGHQRDYELLPNHQRQRPQGRPQTF
ncbi:MAG: hypothetical protein COU65_04820 [Candidatus Pacebacteria bacterium CG10_big_fil_rev_8_21_14_0_10_42_12]|nr:hypothetical protein [Candidatus Paceibacterota bacterium]PIR62164.1 MAG: hypothetical protein COU65_04820 [Candidatus Pacebacteria bacterium CG10_big_fil_rev_8_21_14_0_10_42_12]